MTGISACELEGRVLMHIVGIAICVLAIVTAVWYGWTAVVFVRSLKRRTLPPAADQPWPNASLVLCLRGADPFLKTCLRKIVAQDHPNHEVVIVLDSADGSEARIVNEFLNETEQSVGHVRTLVLADPPRTCSRKVASLLCATDSLDDRVEHVAILDADAIASPGALRQLFAPLVGEPDVGVTFGNRWYASDTPTFGSEVRWCWNTLAVPVMTVHGMPWGGCMGFRRSALDNGLRDELIVGLSDDQSAAKWAIENKHKTRFLPELLLLNRETISLKSCFHFFVRQLLMVRLDHPHRHLILGQGVVFAILLLVVWPLTRSRPGASDYVRIGMRTLLAVFAVSVVLLDGSVRSYLRKQGKDVPKWTVARLFHALGGLVVMPFAYAIAVLKTVTTRQYSWRYVTYRFGRSPRIWVTRVDPVPESQADQAVSV